MPSKKKYKRRNWISVQKDFPIKGKFSSELSSKSEIYVNFSREFHTNFGLRENYLNFCGIESAQERRKKTFCLNLSDVPSVLKME